MNNDDIPDLLVFEYPSLQVWLGNGNGTFTQSNLVDQNPPLSPASAAIADLDGDGNADIVVTNHAAPPYAAPPLSIYYGNADGTFQAAVLLPVSHLYTQLVIADVNQDNKPDLVLSDGAGIAVIENLGGRNFAPEEHFIAGHGIAGLSVVDVNGDGFPDIIAANAGGTPELFKQFPGSGNAFSLTVVPDSMEVSAAGSQLVLVTVVPTAGFQQKVQLSCADGVPDGYECSFSPASLYGGNSYLRVQASSRAAARRKTSAWLYWPTLGIFSILLVGTIGPRRILCLVFIACLGFTTMSGCGNPHASGQRQMVLSIRAMAGTGASKTVNSAQMLLSMHFSE